MARTSSSCSPTIPTDTTISTASRRTQQDASAKRPRPQPSGRRFLGPPPAAESRSVSDLRPVDDAAGSGADRGTSFAIRFQTTSSLRIGSPTRFTSSTQDSCRRPNTNPTASNQQPINNYYDTGQPDPLRSHVFGVRLDYNHSDRNRFFGRVSGSNFTEGAGDWTYESAPGLHALSRVRKTRAGTGNWTRVPGDTVIDGQIGANRFLETDQRLGLKEYTPSGIGLPAYMDRVLPVPR